MQNSISCRFGHALSDCCLSFSFSPATKSLKQHSAIGATFLPLIQKKIFKEWPVKSTLQKMVSSLITMLSFVDGTLPATPDGKNSGVLLLGFLKVRDARKKKTDLIV